MVAFVFLDYINNQTNPQIVTHIRISRVVNGNFFTFVRKCSTQDNKINDTFLIKIANYQTRSAIK